MFPFEHQETLFYCEHGCAQAAQSSSGVSPLGDMQKMSGHGHGRLALCDCLSGRLYQITSRGPTSTILGFHEGGIKRPLKPANTQPTSLHT